MKKSGSLTKAQDNVVFGRVWNETLFTAAVHAAALHTDLAQLPNGKDTELGEQGVTLSGGQRQRINIARALYGYPRATYTGKS